MNPPRLSLFETDGEVGTNEHHHFLLLLDDNDAFPVFFSAALHSLSVSPPRRGLRSVPRDEP